MMSDCCASMTGVTPDNTDCLIRHAGSPDLHITSTSDRYQNINPLHRTRPDQAWGHLILTCPPPIPWKITVVWCFHCNVNEHVIHWLSIVKWSSRGAIHVSIHIHYHPICRPFTPRPSNPLQPFTPANRSAAPANQMLLQNTR